MACGPVSPDNSPTPGRRSRRAAGLLALVFGCAAFAAAFVPTAAYGRTGARPSPPAASARPLVYGGSASFPPFEFLDAHGQPAGFTVAVVRELARRSGRHIVIHLGSWPQILDAYRQGRIDFITAPPSLIRPSGSTSLGRIWTLQDGLVFFHHAVPDSGPGRLPGQRLIVMTDAPPTSPALALTPVQRRHAHIVGTPAEAVRLAYGRPGLLIVGDRLALRNAAARDGLPSPMFVPMALQPYQLLIKAAHAADFAWAGRALADMRRDGTIDRLADELLSPPPQIADNSPSVRDLLIVAAMFLLFLVIAIAGNRSLRRQVNAHSSRLARTVEEKVRLSEALATSHDRYRLLVQSVEDYAIFLLSPEGTVASWNVGAERVSGYTADDALGLPFARFYPLDEVDAGTPGLALAEAAASGRLEHEGWLVRRDGSRFWATVVLRTLRDDNGALRGYSCITRDVTERRRAEAKLAFQARVLSQVHEPIVGIDAEGRVTYWNTGAERLYGVLAADATGHPLSDIYTLQWIQPDDEQRAKATFAATGSWFGEQIHRLRSGEEVYVESFISILTDDQGNAVGSLAATRDVTERRRAREALQARARQQAALAELGQRALADSDIDVLLVDAVHAVVSALGVDCAKILELQGDDQTLLMRAGTGWRDGLVGRALVDCGPTSQAGYTLTVDEPVIVVDLASDQRFTDRTLLGPHDIVSGVSVVIRVPGRPYGVLSAHTRTRRTFTTDDVHYLEAVANVLAVTLQRRRVEAALRESEENYRLLMERASDGIILARPSGTILTANSRACEMLGYTVEEACALGLHELLASEAPPTFPLRLTEVPPGQTALTERQLRRKDGSLLPVEISAKLLDDGRLQAIVRDITERKRASEEITRALSLLSATLEATTDGILTVDSQSRITSFNRRFVEMWQVPDDLIATHEAGPVIAFAVDQLKDAEPLARAAELGARTETETNALIELKDGRVFEASSRPQRLGTTCVGRVWSFRNVTERRRLEAQVRHAQKLESLGVLAGGIAHDFNNLLLGVLGHAGLARMELASESPIQARLEQIELTAQRAAELTNQMLAYSGKGRFVVQTLDLSQLVHEMTHLLHSVISKKADLRLDFVPSLPPVNVDVSQLRQVVMNLITNASDALGDDSGSITIRTGTVNVDAHYLSDTYVNEALPEGPYVFVEVSDTGCGMDAATRARIFDPFFTTKFTGRGLGLAAVLGIVRGHHGAIKVYSEPGLGTTFKVLLPPALQAVQTVARPERVREAWHSTGGVVLVVDDEEGVRTVAQGVLERCGFRVLEARDGLEGVDLFRTHSADIRAVLLDMTMPRMSGVEALREIRRIRQDVPVILSSGYSEEDATDHVRSGLNELAGFIQKPYAAAGLVDKLREVLEA